MEKVDTRPVLVESENVGHAIKKLLSFPSDELSSFTRSTFLPTLIFKLNESLPKFFNQIPC